jgi:hypothetical protein
MAAARKYSREELLGLRDSPGCRDLPPGLDADDLSDLQESCFFDKAPTPDAGIYLGPQRGQGGPGARAPFGAGPARRPAGAGTCWLCVPGVLGKNDACGSCVTSTCVTSTLAPEQGQLHPSHPRPHLTANAALPTPNVPPSSHTVQPARRGPSTAG